MMITNYFKLSHKVELYVPSVGQDGIKLDRAAIEYAIMSVADKLTELFGGATTTPAFGYFKHMDGKVTTEGVNIVFAYAQELTDVAIEAVIKTAETLKKQLNQEAVMIVLDGEAYFI